MRKLKLEMQVSLDGFALDVDGKTDWMLWNWGEDWTWDEALRRRHIDLTTSSDCILLSRMMAEEIFPVTGPTSPPPTRAARSPSRSPRCERSSFPKRSTNPNGKHRSGQG